MDLDDLEPNGEWKARLKKRLEEERASVEEMARKQFEEDIRRMPQDRERLLAEHQSALRNIQLTAESQYLWQLEQVRLKRKWARQKQEALGARIKERGAGDANPNQTQQPGPVAIPPPMQNSSSVISQPLPVFPGRLSSLLSNAHPLPKSSPSNTGEPLWYPRSVASPSGPRGPRQPSGDPDRPDRGRYPSGPFAKPEPPGDERDIFGVTRLPAPSLARLPSSSRGGLGEGGTSPRPIKRPPTTIPLSTRTLHQALHRTSSPFSTIGMRGSSASMRSIASAKGRRVMDGAIPGCIQSGEETGYDADDDAVNQRQSVEVEEEVKMESALTENQRRMQKEQQRQRGVEKSWESRNGGEAEVEDSRPTRSRTEEIEQREQLELEAEERRKQEAQEAQQQERERAAAERQKREAAERDRQEKLQREKEVEVVKRARKTMDAEERFRLEQGAKRREEEKRMGRRRREADERRKKQESGGVHQAGHRRMAEEVRRKRRDKGGGIKSARAPPNANILMFPSAKHAPPASNIATPFPEDRPAPAWTFGGTTTSSTPSSSGFPPRPSPTNLNQLKSVSTGPTTIGPREWQREQQEKFRQEQAPRAAAGASPAWPRHAPATQNAFETLPGVGDVPNMDRSLANSNPSPNKNQSKATLRAEVLRVCSEIESYREMLSTGGVEAQRWLDAFQMVLDDGTSSNKLANRQCLIKALIRLSIATSSYPKCLQLSRQVLKSEDPVAAGSFGDVYRGLIADREVAIKVFRVYQQTDLPKLMKTIWREAILWCQLHHVNVLPCYGVHHLSSELYRVGLVSPWVESGNVVDYLHNNPKAKRLLLLADIAAGMAYLHENKIVHGDLKGANILVSSAGRACLADFGLSTLSDPGLHGWTSSRTTAAKATGTARWQAPELLDPDDDVEVKITMESDIYSYGCVCYEIMTGKLPFHHIKSSFSVMLQVREGGRPRKPAPEDRAFWELGLTEPLWHFIETCWNQHPEQRPTAQDIESNSLLSSLPDRRPLQQWGNVSASEFRRQALTADGTP